MQKAAKKFNIESDNLAEIQNRLANDFLDRGKNKKAFKWFAKAADLGHDDSQFQLGLFYLHATGAILDEQKGIELFMEAARQGHSEAAYNLSTYYDTGFKSFITQNYRKAAELMQNATEKIDAESGRQRAYARMANSRLATYYHLGTSLPQYCAKSKQCSKIFTKGMGA